ncbi:MAG: four helix bundle protein [Patescibacteria group bacterium]
MKNSKTDRKYDLEERTLSFAKIVRDFIKKLPKNTFNLEYSKQLVRSSSSVGANYIEANEAISKKDFLLRIKISRKEAKESNYWLHLIETDGKNDIDKEVGKLQRESIELMMIFSSIMRKSG